MPALIDQLLTILPHYEVDQLHDLIRKGKSTLRPAATELEEDDDGDPTSTKPVPPVPAAPAADVDETTLLSWIIEVALSNPAPAPSAAPKDAATPATNGEAAAIVVPDDESKEPPDPVASLAELFPDADPEWLAEQLRESEDYQDALEKIFEKNGKYPKRASASTSNKRKCDGEEPGGQKKAKLSTQVDPEFKATSQYHEACLNFLLYEEFPHLYNSTVRDMFRENSFQLVPTCVSIHERLKTDLGCVKKSVTKGKGRVGGTDPVFEKHLALWKQIRADVISDGQQDNEAKTETGASGEPMAHPDEPADIECGCCYGEYSLVQMTQCQDGHLFCMECARKAAENVIGLRKTEIMCLDSSGCKFPFPRCEMERFLSEKVLDGYDRLCQEEAIRKAGLSGLVTCPFCDYGAIMSTDATVDKLFHCKSAGCGTISCRLCRKPNHLPKSCAEAAKDDVLDVRHKVEEEMTKALLRECNGCKAKFFKTDGCNKMQCPQCQQLMCYVCKKSIKGYDHFHNSTKPCPTGLCPLWDDSVKRNAEEVANAAKLAVQRLKDENPEIVEADIAVEAPKVPRPVPPNFAVMQAGCDHTANNITVAAAQLTRLEFVAKTSSDRLAALPASATRSARLNLEKDCRKRQVDVQNYRRYLESLRQHLHTQQQALARARKAYADTLMAAGFAP
ncbi:hypothetical protein DFJ73DRAFT_825167 [Zopfochytrium polystomum]|nr:hypothetical protein DFJ73DRAFT_825167 [Zopfochytrium polystomum]